MFSLFPKKSIKKGSEEKVKESGNAIVDQRPEGISQKSLQKKMNESAGVSHSSKLQSSINNSKALIAQRKKQDILFGANPVQKKEKEEDPLQMQQEEEEPLQRMKDEEEEPVQRMKDEEEQPLQRMKDEEEEPMQRMKEEEEPKQLKESNSNATGTSTTAKSGLPSNLKSGIEQLSGISMDDVNVHYNSSKPAELNALAYAQGNEIHLGAGQEKHLPHEAWHVVQQRQGRVKATTQMKGAAINDDSLLEKEADEMGQKALGNRTNSTVQRKSVSSEGSVTQLYTDVLKADQTATNWSIGSDARVADNGWTVTSNQVSHLAYALPWMITYSNNLLKAKGSGIEIKAGTKKVKGPAPDGSGIQELTEVVPTIKASTSVSGTQDFWADCGRSSREVMGKHGTDSSPHGTYKDNSGKLKETVSSKNPADFRDEILIKSGLGTTASSARAAYLALSPVKKDEFDKKHKINKYASPEVGEAFVSRRDDTSTMKGFNFHWGGVIMTPGNDRVTLENFAKSGTTYDTKDEKWYFETYGPASKKGQTFHERNEGSVGAKGKNNTTMSASTSSFNAKIAADVALRKGPDSKSSKIADLTKGATFTIIDRLNFWAKITITSGPSVGKIGWINKSFIAY